MKLVGQSSSLYGPPADCWALGVTALELLSGCCLFNFDNGLRPTELTWEDFPAWDSKHTAGLHAEWVRAHPG
jgi:hypothetical protein